MGQEKRNAVELKSGNAVDHSAPVLSQPTRPSTAGRKPEASLVSAKSGREFEGGTLIGGTAAVPFASLDQEQNNCDKPRDPYRLRRCGRLSLRGVAPVSPKSQKFAMVRCKTWDCETCAPRKAARYRRAIGELAEAHRLTILLTLTLDPKTFPGGDSIRYINRIFAHFRTYLKRKLGQSPEYIRVLEMQKNGRAHLHILLNRFVRQDWISEAWASLGGGKIVDIRRVDIHRVSHYLSKYPTKEMLMSAPKRARRVTTSRGIKLNPKVRSELSWSLVSIPVGRLYEVYAPYATNVQRDAEGNVTAFELDFQTGSGTEQGHA